MDLLLAAINKLAELVKRASLKSQIILSTQSTNLLNCFDADDIIVVDRTDNQSVFRRLSSKELEEWIDKYDLSISDLWEKNRLAPIMKRVYIVVEDFERSRSEWRDSG